MTATVIRTKTIGSKLLTVVTEQQSRFTASFQIYKLDGYKTTCIADHVFTSEAPAIQAFNDHFLT